MSLLSARRALRRSTPHAGLSRGPRGGVCCRFGRGSGTWELAGHDLNVRCCGRPRPGSGAVQPSVELWQSRLRLCIGFRSVFWLPSSSFFSLLISRPRPHSDLCSRWICYCEAAPTISSWPSGVSWWGIPKYFLSRKKNNDCTCKHETIIYVNVKWAKQAEGRGRVLQADPEVLPVHCSRTAGAPKQAAL